MTMIHIIRLMLLLCFLLHFCGIACNTIVRDRDALLFFKSQVSDPNNALSSWVPHSTHHCTWYGVTCSKLGSRVKSLTLPALGLSGTLTSHLSNLTYLHSLDLSYNTFQGQIPTELTHLSLLNNIKLAYNNLSGTIPPELGKLQHLQLLDLSVNTLLTGQIPAALGNLSSLRYLALSRNSLMGEIPTELGKLRNLSYLQLSQNNLTGEFPNSIFNLSSLVFLSVTKNNLSGKLPQNFGLSLPNIRNLSLASNMFEGVIPDSISNASELEHIDLANNQFHGYLPQFSNLKNLIQLILGNNSLSSTTSLNLQFFQSLRNSTKLQKLWIYDNHLAGELPISLANLSSSLQHLCVAGNRLTGSIPRGMENFQNLVSLSLEENYFSGQVPPEIGALKNLERILLYSNRLSGEIPDTFGNLTKLFVIAMEGNQFSGRIHSSIGQCKRLSYLGLEMNRLVGTIPKEIFELPSLTTLYVGGNSLHGSLPYGASTMKQLETFDVSNNQLSGSIPTDLGTCFGLKELLMGRNNFSGSIPDSLGNLLSLEALDISSNNLTGTIPETLEKLKYMVTLNLSFNHLEGQVPTKGVFMNLSKVDLQGNNKLCSLNIETVQKLGVLLCDVGKKKRRVLLPIILAVTGAIALFISILSLLWMRMCRKKKNEKGNVNLSPATLKGLPQNIPYSDIRLATNNFAAENLIGKGGFGSVYKGVISLSTDEATTVAVKVLDLQLSKATKSFNAECEALRNVRHRNLVKVITVCSSVDYKGDDFKAIVMQFMANGNLDKWLYPTYDDHESGSSLTLLQRLNIAIDVASAMDYLHHDCDPPIVHCDLKPVNVLLDEDMVAHVGDFGLARFLLQNPSEKESSTLGLKGSIGYIAPEYGAGGKASTSGDVYSFGILLLEMFIGKKPTDEMFKEGLSLNKYALAMDENQVLNVCDPRLIDCNEYSTQICSIDFKSDGSGGYRCNSNDKMHWTRKAEECIADVISVGLSCTTQVAKDRWTMREASTKLQGIRKALLFVCT